MSNSTVCSKEPFDPNEAARSSKNNAQPDHDDPIFLPREYVYTWQDLAYIASLAPLSHVPESLIPSEDIPEPPVIHYAWLIDDRVRKHLLEEAKRRGLLFYGYRLNVTDPRQLTAPFDPKTEKPDLDEDTSMECAAEAIIKEMGSGRWTDQYINFVLLPNEFNVPAFTVYTNHEIHDPPSDEAIERLRVQLGFTGKPKWYPDGLGFQWIE
ncbi:hypothetical protein NM688_g726 [Phlebia brevispora]|uniref:Uncharacterized protein n=1 Tax=Phlebia brevispora TaxID=194682 RepID=A0ACC1TDC5_9APHY|nr:hypothetical protein NM688_g726 [Phlebia brevispora]